jgi:hypothetical protein
MKTLPGNPMTHSHLEFLLISLLRDRSMSHEFRDIEALKELVCNGRQCGTGSEGFVDSLCIVVLCIRYCQCCEPNATPDHTKALRIMQGFEWNETLTLNSASFYLPLSISPYIHLSSLHLSTQQPSQMHPLLTVPDKHPKLSSSAFPNIDDRADGIVISLCGDSEAEFCPFRGRR